MRLYGWRSKVVGFACFLGVVSFHALPVHAQPNVVGQWGPLLDSAISTWPSMQAIHAVVLKNGKVLLVDDPGRNAYLWDPTDESILIVGDTPEDQDAEPPRPRIRVFCSGHAQLADGRVAFFGGGGHSYGESHRHIVIFNPDAPLSDPWTVAQNMPEVVPGQTGVDAGKRWYPRATTLGDGSVLVLGGGNNYPMDDFIPPPDDPYPDTDDIHALFRAWLSPTNQSTPLSAQQHFNWYPFSFLQSDGKVFVGGSHYYPAIAVPPTPPADLPTESQPVKSYRLDSVIAGSWVEMNTNASSTIKGGSAVMYRPDKIMKAGGGLSGNQGNSCTEVTTISKRAMTIDLNNPVWTDIATMNHPRIHFYLVVLPDGKVLAVGGTQYTGQGGCNPASPSNQPVLQAESYDPDEGPSAVWKPLAAMTQHRLYHSSAVLLPDARILIAGGQHVDSDGNGSLDPQKTAQVFSPPYLFQSGGQPATRPTITEVSSAGSCGVLRYNQPLTITTGTGAADTVKMVSLIRLGSATHSQDFDARFIALGPAQFNPPVSGQFTIPAAQVPQSGNHAPPGYYMLFVINTNDVPSVAKIVRVCDDCNAAAVVPAPHAADAKNRTVSVSLPTPSTVTCSSPPQTALRIRPTDLQYPQPPNLPQFLPPNFSGYESGSCAPRTCVGGPKNGATCVVPAPVPTDCPGGGTCALSMCVGGTENGAVCMDPTDCPGGGTCTALEQNGCARWVGKPGTFLEAQDIPLGASYRAARLQCTPYYKDWSVGGLVHVTGAEIVPSSTYELQVFASSCMGSETTCTAVSTPLTITTARYGDVEAPFNPPATSTQPDAIDVAQVVAKVKNLPGALVKARSQLQPNLVELNADVSALDIVAVVEAVKGFAYPFSGPCPCPSDVPCGSTECKFDGACENACPPGAKCKCVKTCTSGVNTGDPCINNSHCPGGTCGIPDPLGNKGFCRDRCGRCSP